MNSRGTAAAHGPGSGLRRPSFREKKRRDSSALASDALPLPVWLTNAFFSVTFVVASYYLLHRWQAKRAQNISLHFLTLGEIVAIVADLASFTYLIGFFGIDFVQTIISKSSDGEESPTAAKVEKAAAAAAAAAPKMPPRPVQLDGKPLKDQEDELLAAAVASNQIPSYSLEKELGDAQRAAVVRRRSVEIRAKCSLQGLPVTGLNYESVMGQCCEMVIGHVQIPVGVAGPLLLDGVEYMVPMATTEGCLVASTNRGCKVIQMAGGASSTLTRDGMTRAPVVRCESAVRAAELKFFLAQRENFEQVAEEFNRSSRFARLQEIQVALAGRNAYLRFSCSTGDAMGMNMVSKGVQNALDFLQAVFPDLEVMSISGNFCADKKPTAVNWIEGRGRSVCCEVVVPGDILRKVLKTSVHALVELNTLKNLVGSAMAGAVGGFNAHAANMVAAIFIATGQDPAQVVESSACITLMEAVNDGRDLHVSVTMPTVEVGTVGGGTQLASQAAMLNLLGVRGANKENPGGNARQLARVVAGGVLAGELSLMAALAAGQLVKSHMKFNRSSANLAETAAVASGPSTPSGLFRRAVSSPALRPPRSSDGSQDASEPQGDCLKC